MAAAYLADDLQLVPIGAMECDAWPSVAIIEHGRVVEPVRLLARPSRRKAGRLVVFLSEVAVNEPAVRAVSTSILQWCTRRGIRTIVSLESATVEAEPNEVPSVRLWGVSEQPNGNRRLAKAGMPLAVEGVVGGLTGCLLRQGLDSPIEVIGLVESCHASEPDLRGAQALVEFLARFLHLPVRVGRLHKDTQAFQKHLVDVERRRQANDPAAAADERDFI